jgi:hypothetical protein
MTKRQQKKNVKEDGKKHPAQPSATGLKRLSQAKTALYIKQHYWEHINLTVPQVQERIKNDLGREVDLVSLHLLRTQEHDRRQKRVVIKEPQGSQARQPMSRGCAPRDGQQSSVQKPSRNTTRNN